MLAALLAPAVIQALFSAGVDLFRQYQQGKITIEQLRTQLGVIAIEEATKVERANADMVARTYASFTDLAKTSTIVRWAFFIVTVSQALVLVWAQVGIPFMVWKFGGPYPSSGVTIEWGYGLLVLLCGGGMVAIKRPRQPPVGK